MTGDQHLANGWTYSREAGTVYHFEHWPLAKAKRLAAPCERLQVIETVNWTLADGERQNVHLNQYFALGLPEALGLAARLTLAWQDVAEDVVRIRPATPEEERLYWLASDRLEPALPALADAELAGGEVAR